MVSDSASGSEPAGSEPLTAENGASAEADVASSAASKSPQLNGSATAQSDSAPDPNPNREPREEQPPKVQTPLPLLPAPAAESSLWPDRLAAAAAALYQWLSRPRVRLTVTGVILLLIGGLLMSSSVWTLPLVIVGALMVGIAWIGRRLDGRFALEWGETGTQLEFRAKIRAAQPARPAVPRTSSGSRKLVRTHEHEREQPEIIEGEAHTVEIDVADLKALIAAVETTTGEVAHAEEPAQATRNLRVAYGGARSSDASR